MKRVNILLVMACITISGYIYGQIGISADGSNPDKSAMLDIMSSSKGVLLPRMTSAEMKNIWQPAAGLVIFNTDSSDFFGYNGSRWIAFWDVSDTISRYCPDSIYYSSQWYTTVQIGTQCWMAENMNAGTQITGGDYPVDNGIIEKYCYLNVPDSCAVYGGLYRWQELMAYNFIEGSQGICPSGWHIPSAAQWDVLTAYLGGSEVAGGKVKATGTRYWLSPNEGATNSSGFTALGSGTYDPVYGWQFYLIRSYCGYWTSTGGGLGAWRRDLNYTVSDLSPYNCQMEHAFSVRCLKN